MDVEDPSTEQLRRYSGYVSFAMYCVSAMLAAGAILGFAIQWWSGSPVWAVLTAVSMLGASGYMIDRARHVYDEVKKLDERHSVDAISNKKPRGEAGPR